MASSARHASSRGCARRLLLLSASAALFASVAAHPSAPPEARTPRARPTRSARRGAHSAWADSHGAPPPLERQWQPVADAAASTTDTAAVAARTQPRQLVKSGLHAPVASVQGLITRALGAQYVPAFELQVVPLASNGNDVFELDGSTGAVIIRGSSGYALAAGLNWYVVATWSPRSVIPHLRSTPPTQSPPPRFTARPRASPPTITTPST